MVSTGTKAGELYKAPKGQVVLVEVPQMPFLVVDGLGDPNSEGFKQVVQALYSLSYAIKFMLKKSRGLEHKVGPLEGLWWVEGAEGMSFEELLSRRGEWSWTLMIAQPEALTPEDLERARAELRRKKGLERLERVRLERFGEGLCAQTLHVGPYAAEGPTLARLHAAIAEQGYAIAGKHHEIYLGDPLRAAPEKLRTLIRYPVRKA